jgi:hypothetical protein
MPSSTDDETCSRDEASPAVACIRDPRLRMMNPTKPIPATSDTRAATSVRGLVALGRRRLRAMRLLEALPMPLLVAAVAMLAVVFVDRLWPGVLPSWGIAAAVLASAAVVAAIVVAIRRDPGELAAAIEIDRVLGLRDRLSVAIESANRRDLFARAACEDAARAARAPEHRRRIREGLALRAPTRWWWPIPAWATAVGLALLLPNLRGEPALAESAATDTAREEAQESLESLVAEVRENEMLAETLAGDESLDIDETAFEDLDDPEEIRLEAIRQVTALEERLESMLESDDARAAEALREQLAGLDVPEEGPARDLALAMRMGDHAAAAEAIEALRERLEQGEPGDDGEEAMSAEERQRLAEQLEQLASNLERNGAGRERLAESMRAAGIDPQAAGELSDADLERLEQLAEQLENLTDSQREELMQAARAAQRSQQDSQRLSEAMRRMAGQCSQTGEGEFQQGEPGEFGQDAQRMLSELERMEAMMRQARAAQGQCRSRARGLGMQGFLRPGNGNGDREGPGMGGRGRGRGGEPPRMETPTGSEVVREAGEIGPGDVIAREFFEGPLDVGEARIPLERIERRLDAADPAAATGDDPVPPHLRDAHRHYFGSLRSLVRPAGSKSAPDSPAAKENSE